MAWNSNNLNDAIYDALNVAGVTALLPNGNADIFLHQRPRNVAITYPVVVYYPWRDPVHHYALSDTRSHTEGDYRITAWTENDPRAAADLGAAIDAALTNVTFSVSGGTLLVCRARRTIDREQAHDDTLSYYENGGIYEIGVAV